ncbi:ATP synthase subunit I [Desulfofundulus thermobenzoicus]|nr:ATP synthase subunit I [Desulfofundulus thermobenzoicus]
MPSLPSIPELDNQLKRTLRITGGLLVLTALAVAASPRDPLAWGLLLGLLTGMYNTYSLALRIGRLGGLSRQSARGYMRQGLVMRLALVAAVVLVAGRVTGVNILWLGAGMLLVPCITAVDAAVFAARQSRSEGKYFSEIEKI